MSSNEAANITDLRLSVELDSSQGGVQRVTVHIEGRGELAVQAAARITEIYERSVAGLLPAAAAKVTGGEPTPTAMPTTPTAMPRPVPASRPTPWFQRHRRRISGGVGIALFALALGVPLIVPVEMRREILPMPIAFGLVGALSLFSAMLPDPAPKQRSLRTQQPAPLTPAGRPMPRRLPSSAPPSNVRRKVGAGFGALFVLGGAIAPFVLAGSADDRFLMMIGFAPIAAIGAFLIWVFTRTPAGAAPVAGSASAAAKAQTKPASKMTAALTALAVMLTIVVVLVLLATLLQVAGS